MSKTKEHNHDEIEKGMRDETKRAKLPDWITLKQQLAEKDEHIKELEERLLVKINYQDKLEARIRELEEQLNQKT